MVIGDIKGIDLGTSRFQRIIENDSLYVDKTRMIENFLKSGSEVHLIARQRRLGKSLNMDMLRCFLTDRADLRHLFKGLYIESSSVWSKANSAPVFYFDFKGLGTETYLKQIINKVIDHVCVFADPDKLDFSLKRKFQQIIDDPLCATDSLYFLTEVAYKITGKRSYILIDEYDKLLLENYDSSKYEEIRAFETALLSSALKGNQYLEKALLTGVMRISHESMLSGLNNIVTFDVFNDNVYTHDYGLTDDEVEDLSKLVNFNTGDVRAWYNGIRVGGHTIYNIYSVMSYIDRGSFECYWGKSGTMDMIINLLNDKRKATLVKLLNGEKVEVTISSRVSLRNLSGKGSDQAFYCLLVQAGYLALDGVAPVQATSAIVSIPNAELMTVWKEFLLERLYPDIPQGAATHVFL